MQDQKRRKILNCALRVFFKYGYKRVSMNEIAEAAEISRPGLYLYFESKEVVFNEAIRQHADELLTEIAEGLNSYKTAKEKLAFAFDVWSVKNFDLHVQSPEAREIADSSYIFAREVTEVSREKFESIVISILKADRQSRKIKHALLPERAAQILSGALRGFKLVAKDGPSLRSMIGDLISVLLLKRS